MFAWIKEKRRAYQAKRLARSRAYWYSRLGLPEPAADVAAHRPPGSRKPGDPDYSPLYDGFFCFHTVDGPNIVGYVDHDGSRVTLNDGLKTPE